MYKKKDVRIKCQHNWTGWDATGLVFNGAVKVNADITIFALGGKSWSITGSDGAWLNTFKNEGVLSKPFQVSNCAYGISWNKAFIEKYNGCPLKNIAISCSGKRQKGEVVLTRFGLEGNAIYALSPQIRDLLNTKGKAEVFIDLKPTLSKDVLLKKIEQSVHQKTSEILKKDLNMSSVQIALVKCYVTKNDFMDTSLLIGHLKGLKIDLITMAPIDEAISTVGGIDLSSLEPDFKLKNQKHTYCIGEMLDWDAPTGGYLLQACFSMGVALARSLNNSRF